MNFHHALLARYGYGSAADSMRDAFLDGRRADAVAAVPDAMIDELCLVGSPERLRERLEIWAASDVTTLLAHTHDVSAVRTIANAVAGAAGTSN